MSLRSTAAVVGLLAGCAGSPIRAEPQSTGSAESQGTERGVPGERASREVSVELHTASKSGPGWQSVMPGASLDSGTEFAVRVAVGQPAFLYVGQRTAGSDMALIYPAATPVRAEPSQPAQLPAAGQWFRLDNHTGEEALFVLLSAAPQQVDAAKQLLGARAAAACAQLRDPPPPDVKHRDRGGSVRGKLGEDGLAVLCFPFHHQ